MAVTLTITVLALLISHYFTYQKGRKIGREETTWLQKMSMLLMQSLTGYPRPHLTVIPITEDNCINKGNRHEYPECPEGFSLCVLLVDFPAKTKNGEQAQDEIIKILTQEDYLDRACSEFEKKEGVIITSKLVTREEIEKTSDGEVKIFEKLVFLKVDTRN